MRKFASIRFDCSSISIRFSWIRFDFDSIQFDSVRFRFKSLDSISILFGSIWFDSIEFRSIRRSILCSIPSSFVRFEFDSAFDSVEFLSI